LRLRRCDSSSCYHQASSLHNGDHLWTKYLESR
jgi:hypothetical protein